MFSHSFVGGSKSLADLDREVHIHEPVWTGGSTNPLADLDRGFGLGLKYPLLLQSLLSMNQVKIENEKNSH